MKRRPKPPAQSTRRPKRAQAGAGTAKPRRQQPGLVQFLVRRLGRTAAEQVLREGQIQHLYD